MSDLRTVTIVLLLMLAGCGGADTKDSAGGGPGGAKGGEVDPRIAESQAKIKSVAAAIEGGDLAAAEQSLAPLSAIKEELPVELALKIDALEREAAQLRATKDLNVPDLPPLPPPTSE